MIKKRINKEYTVLHLMNIPVNMVNMVNMDDLIDQVPKEEEVDVDEEDNKC